MTLEAFLNRDRVVTGAGLLAVAALAWLYLLREPMSASAMESMHGGADPSSPAPAMHGSAEGEDSELPP